MTANSGRARAGEMRMLEIKNLKVSIEDKLILDNLSLTVRAGEVAAIMGPNGSGKSTLAYVLAGKPAYDVQSGQILLDGENLLDLEPTERALKGVFLAFQYPTEIPGVTAMTFLKAALNAQRRAHGKGDLTTPDFMRRVREFASAFKIDQEMLRRPLNVGFSGGEKRDSRSCRWLCWRRGSASSTRPTRASTLTRSELSRKASTAFATRSALFSSSRTISGSWITSNRMLCT